MTTRTPLGWKRIASYVFLVVMLLLFVTLAAHDRRIGDTRSSTVFAGLVLAGATVWVWTGRKRRL